MDASSIIGFDMMLFSSSKKRAQGNYKKRARGNCCMHIH
jgi:hypothetical protein